MLWQRFQTTLLGKLGGSSREMSKPLLPGNSRIEREIAGMADAPLLCPYTDTMVNWSCTIHSYSFEVVTDISAYSDLFRAVGFLSLTDMS
jgi:hypothetical protein